MKKTINFLGLIALLLTASLVSAKTLIKVGVFENRPIVFLNEEQQVAGLSVDILERIASEEDWQLEYVYDNFKKNFKRLENNEIDLIVGLAYTEARAEKLKYTQQTLLNNWGVVFQHEDQSFVSIEDLQQKRVALVDNNIHSKVFDSLMSQFGFSYFPVFVNSPDQLFEAIEKGQADAGVINRLTSLTVRDRYKIKPTSIIFNPVEVRYASSPATSDQYVKKIDEYLELWRKETSSYYYESLDKWINNKASGTSYWLEYWLIGFILLALSASFIVGYIRNIVRKNSLALGYRQKEQEYILENLVDGAIIIDEKGTVQLYNRAAEKIFQFKSDEVIGRNVSMLMPEHDATRHDEYLNHYKMHGSKYAVGTAREVIAKRKDGQCFPMRLSVAELPKYEGQGVRFIGTCVDLTLQKQQDKYIQRTHKMDALGQLTGGIAHDYNNMLGVILGYSDLLREKLEEGSRLQSYAEQIRQAASRGVALTKKLLTFSRNSPTDRESINLNQLLEEQALMLEKTLTPRIRLVFEFDETLKPVFVDKSEMIESIVNIAVNAMHAMPDGGIFTIKTRNVNFDKDTFMYMNDVEGAYVHVSLSDTGIGMSEDLQSHIFEPFFSTKGDKGTGLGMSQVYGFATDHGGAVDVQSRLGLGSRFHLFLPVYNGEFNKEEDKQVVTLSGQMNQTILVVDDESSILGLVKEVAEMRGYKVILANGGIEALEKLQKHSVDLILSDIIMPDIDGYSLYEKVMKDFPETRFQFMTGFGDIKGRENIPENLLNNVLNKPFSSAELIAALKKNF